MPEAPNKHASTSSRQDFIAKIRYNNDLPPPPCAPKLLNYTNVKDPQSLESTTFLSGLFRTENFGNLVPLNDDLGMTMNVMKMPECIEKNSISSLGALTPEYGDGLNLHPSDQLLLTDPVRSTTVKGETVPFLRRTQYIAADKTQLPSRYSAGTVSTASATRSILQKKMQLKKGEELDPKEQLRAVESMFDTTVFEGKVEKLRHPIRKNLRAKRVWNFLPDTSMLDQKFYDVKFLSSASIRKGKSKKESGIKSENDPRLLTSMFREIKVNAGTTLVSCYTTNTDSAKEIRTQLNDENENAPISKQEAEDSAGTPSYTYDKVRDYDGKVKPFADSEKLRHLAITFNEKTKTAMYIPLSGKLELRKGRIDPYLEPKVREMSYDQIYLSIREPTREEIDYRDMLRSDYDPMEFGAEDEETGEGDDENEEEKGKEDKEDKETSEHKN